MKSQQTQIHIRIGIDELPYIDDGLDISQEKNIHITHVGQHFSVHCLTDFQFVVTAFDNDHVELDGHADVQSEEYDVLSNSRRPTDKNKWHNTVSAIVDGYSSFDFLLPGHKKSHFATIELKLCIGDQQRMTLARQACDEGRWDDALCIFNHMKKEKAPRSLLLRCRYQAALQIETGVPEQGIKCNQKAAYIRMHDLYQEVNYNDAIHDEVIRTYARYIRDGIGVSASPDRYNRIIEANIIGARTADRTEYEGPVDTDGLPHGEGTMNYFYGEKQERYTGHFEHGVREGEGKLMYLTTVRNSMTESEYYMQGDYDGCGRQISSPPAGSYQPYLEAWCIDYQGPWHNDRPLPHPEE